jgi:uncharacterized protein YecT (DUF1311 family)
MLISQKRIQLFLIGLFWASAAQSQTQLEMTTTAGTSLNAADRKLNATYQQVITKYRGNSSLISKLRSAESAWIAYRDAYLHSIFPAEDNPHSYGSAFRMCHFMWLQTATETRTEQLKEFLLPKQPSGIAEDMFRKEEQSLNAAYQKVLTIYDKADLAALRHCELLWISFRDADADAFANVGPPKDNATMRLARKVSLDRERTKELSQWINGIEEGGVCGGCIPVASTTPSSMKESADSPSKKVEVCATVRKSTVPSKSGEPHSLGLTPEELRVRFKRPDPGAFEMKEYVRNPDTGDLECSVTDIDRTTGIAAKVRNSDHKLGLVTLIWNIPVQDTAVVNENGVTEQQGNSLKQFMMTLILLVEAIDPSLRVDDRNQMLNDLGFESRTAHKDSQSSKNGITYRTHWSDHKLALSTEAEKEMQQVESHNSQATQTSRHEISSNADDVALLKALTDSQDYDARKGVSPSNFPDMDSYREEGWRRLIVIAKIYEDRYHDPGRALDYYNLVKNNMTGVHTGSRELDDKVNELRLRMIQQGYKPHHYEVIDPRYTR